MPNLVPALMDPESGDYTDGVFFERRFLVRWGLNLTLLQELVIVGIMVLSLFGSGTLSFALLHADLITGATFMLVILVMAGVFGLMWCKAIDRENRELKKTQIQYVCDRWRARHRRGHWVNGRRSIAGKSDRVVLTVGSLHPRRR